MLAKRMCQAVCSLCGFHLMLAIISGPLLDCGMQWCRLSPWVILSGWIVFWGRSKSLTVLGFGVSTLFLSCPLFSRFLCACHSFLLRCRVPWCLAKLPPFLLNRCQTPWPLVRVFIKNYILDKPFLAASTSASNLLLPSPREINLSFKNKPTVNFLAWAKPSSLSTW